MYYNLITIQLAGCHTKKASFCDGKPKNNDFKKDVTRQIYRTLFLGQPFYTCEYYIDVCTLRNSLLLIRISGHAHEVKKCDGFVGFFNYFRFQS